MFGLSKKQKEKEKNKKINDEEKNLASENRKSGEKVASALNTAASKVAGIDGVEARAKFESLTRLMADKIRVSPTSGYCDLSKIDSLLKKIADEYGIALACGDDVCAKKTGAMLNDIIAERAKLAECQKEDAEDEAAKVEAFAQGACTLIGYYKTLRNNKTNSVKSEKEHTKLSEEYDKQKEKTKAKIKADPAAEELLKSYIPGKSQLTPQAKDIMQSKSRAKSLYSSRETARIAKDVMTKQSEALERFIQELGLILEQRDTRLSDSQIEDTKEILTRYTDMLVGINDQTEQLSELSDHFDRLLESIDNDMDYENRGMQINAWYDKILKMEAEQEASYEEGRRLAQQRENERRQTNEN